MKKDLFDYVCMQVLDGARFSVDFKARSLKVNGKYIVKDGVSEIEQSGRYVPENFLYHIEDFYEGYKHSVPSERSESRSRNYFKALPEKELSDEDMMYGRYRNSGARHHHESETKANISNVKKSDNFVKHKNGQSSSTMNGANNKSVRGVHPQKKILSERLTNALEKEIGNVKDEIQEKQNKM